MALVYPSPTSYQDNGYYSRSRRNSVYSTAPSNMPYSSQSIYANYSRPTFDGYGHAASAPIGGRGYDDIDTEDGYYMDDRRRSQSYLPMTAHSTMSMPTSSRYRRNSGVSFTGVPHSMTMPTVDYRRPSSLRVKFKRKGSLFAGVNLAEAQDRVRLSNNDAFSYHDFHADSQRKILLKIKWTGYSSMTYEIPLDGYDGRVSLQTLARRISRACVHYLQANVVPVPWNCVQLHHLEEVAYGVWQPMLST